MPPEIIIYFEGDPRLRLGFHKFLNAPRGQSGSPRPHVRPIGWENRDRALKMFALSLTDPKHRTAVKLLLVDAEGPVSIPERPWEHLANLKEGRLLKPRGASDDQGHLMVQIMESWFLADGDALAKYYGQGFAPRKLPKRRDIESIPKADVVRVLKDAAQGTARKTYSETKHAPSLLQEIDPAKVRAASPWCDRLFATLEKAIQPEVK